MKNRLTADFRGLKCYDQTCDYQDVSIELEQYKSYIDEPCPKCGLSLLTQADYDQVQNIISSVNTTNSLPYVRNESNGEKAKSSFEFNGTGNVEMKVERYEG